MKEYSIEDICRVAMSIIAAASEARSELKDIYTDIAEGNYENAEKKLDAANAHITEAHQAQTNYLQDAVAEGFPNVPILMVHAQDILMSVSDEIRNDRAFIEIFKKKFHD